MRYRTGLTLIELTAAMAIAGMLVTATLGVSARLAAREKVASIETDDAATTQAVCRLLEADLLPARRYRMEDAGLWLETWSHLDPKTAVRAHLPAVVSYEIREMAGSHWLVRLQRVPGGEKPSGDLVCRGVRRINLVAPRKSPRHRGRWRALPPGRRVTVEFNDDRPPVEMFFYTE